jgi:adenine-specific DNA-methyltransferase
MKGFVPTPAATVDLMVAKLFSRKPPEKQDAILDPGCGMGAFIDGIHRWCKKNDRPVPRILGIESDPKLAKQARERFSRLGSVTIAQQDFLAPLAGKFDYIIGNPPYVSILKLSEPERAVFRRDFLTAKGRFDLYLLFFERALSCLKPDGRLVFITPEKFLYVETARPLRMMLAKLGVEEIHLVDETIFAGLATYPTITTVLNTSLPRPTKFILRDGRQREVQLTANVSSWMPLLNGDNGDKTDYTLKDICVRISCGVATGADGVYVVRNAAPDLRRFAYSTIAGSEISPYNSVIKPQHLILTPYSASGELLPENQLGQLREYLQKPDHREVLLKRTCVARKPWYAFHETPPLPEILRPKLLCKDITRDSFFVIDEIGDVVPRHSVYYIVPKDPDLIYDLANYLNSPKVKSWLRSHCQRATHDFLRLQSHVLKRIPIPRDFVEEQLPLSASAEQISA